MNTPRRLTDANGQAVWQWPYSAFGDEKPTIAKNRFANLNLNPNPGTTSIAPITYNVRHPGQYEDVESGLYQNRHRDYDKRLGRYTQFDPIGLQGGSNGYVYAEANPLIISDSTGLCPFCLAIPFIGGGITLTDIGVGAALGGALAGLDRMFNNPSRPPAGSVPISGSPWSGDHGGIKGALGLGGRDSVFIDPDGNVWVQHPDGSWSNEGPASDYTGSGRASGRRGKDRDRRNCP